MRHTADPSSTKVGEELIGGRVVRRARLFASLLACIGQSRQDALGSNLLHAGATTWTIDDPGIHSTKPWTSMRLAAVISVTETTPDVMAFTASDPTDVC